VKNHLVHLTIKDLDDFIAVISSAFVDDPLFIKLFANEKVHKVKQAQIKAFVRFLFTCGYYRKDEIIGIYHGNKLVSVALVEVPKTFSLTRYIKTFAIVPALLHLLIKLPFKTGQFLNLYFLQTRKSSPKKPHHYLVMLATIPSYQGLGVGKQLLNYINLRIEKNKHSVGLALDTENKSNIALYESFGFQLIAATELDNLPVYCLFKKISNPSKALLP